MGSRRSVSRPLVIGLALVLAACAAGGCTQYATPTERLPRGDDAVGDWRGSPRDPGAATSCPSSERNAAGRTFVVLQATALGPAKDGRRQFLIEAGVWSVRSGGPIEVIDKAERDRSTEAPVWFMDEKPTRIRFGPGARLEQKPSVVAVEADIAAFEVGGFSRNGSNAELTRIRVMPQYQADGVLGLSFSLEHFENGLRVHAVPRTQLQDPVGRVYIIESRPVR